MNGKFLLDTNVLIALFAEDAAARTAVQEAPEVFIPSVVLGELYYGAEKSSRAEYNRARIDELAATGAILNVDAGTAREYGSIKHALRAAGRHIPENDIWIAALARQHDLTLVTRDHHFRAVMPLTLVQW